MQAVGKCTDLRKMKKVVDVGENMRRGGDGCGEGPGLVGLKSYNITPNSLITSKTRILYKHFLQHFA